MKRGDQVRDARKLYDKMMDIVASEFARRMGSDDIELTEDRAEVFGALDALEECELLADVLDDMDAGVDASEAMSARLDDARMSIGDDPEDEREADPQLAN
jgi:hypothetical protein